jgi:hypothetical protein
MTMARAHLVDVSMTRWYHCITRCVRRALLLGEGLGHASYVDTTGRLRQKFAAAPRVSRCCEQETLSERDWAFSSGGSGASEGD